MSRARATVYGFIAIFGIPVLGLIWLVSVTPSSVWVFLGACVVLALCIGFIGPGFARDPDEAKRKAQVQLLQRQVSALKSEIFATRDSIWEAGSSIHGGSRIHEIPPLERRLARQESELAKARLELNRIWKQSDGPPFGGWGGDF